MSWPELGYAFLLAVVLWPLDFLLLVFLVTVPVVMVLAPALAETDDMAVLGWHIDPGPEAWLAVLVGLALAVVAAYAVTLAAVAQAAWPGCCSSRARRSWPRRWPTCAGRGWTWSTPSRPSAAGSSATCTTASSSGWSPSP